MTARAHARAALAACALAGACGAAPPPVMELNVTPAWNAEPASTAEIGYGVAVEVVLPGRDASCVPLRDLRITVNDSEYSIAAGDCATNVSVAARPVRTDVDTVVTVRHREGPLGAATFRDLFTGVDGLQVVSPPDGRVRVGETLALALLSAPPPGDSRVTGAVHWLDLPASVPPFYSSVQANANADVTGFAVTAPMLTGRGQLVLRWFSSPPGAGPARVDGDGCTGFSVCRGGDSRITLGPVAIEVIP